MEHEKLDDFFKKLDRTFFIDNEYKYYAYFDKPLPIGHKQTISQPSLVYMMTMELDLNKTLNVLEIGTGSGYQTAFIAEFSKNVYTVERIKELSEKAQARLSKLNYSNIKYKVDNGSEGWKEFAPYDRIIVTAAAREIPPSLINQLKHKGKMIIPVGRSDNQNLLLVNKNEKGQLEEKSLGVVRFVQLVGEYSKNI